MSCAQNTAQMELQTLKNKCDFSADPRFASLRGKVPLSPDAEDALPTLAEINYSSRPTPEERKELLEADAATQFCREGAIEIIDRYASPDVAGAARSYSLAQTNVLKLLVNGDISYGTAREVGYELLARWQQILGEYDRAQQIADAASQQAAAAQMSAAAQAFSAFNQHPAVTNCSLLGANISCVSQ
jgi:hypothetical protein